MYLGRQYEYKCYKLHCLNNLSWAQVAKSIYQVHLKRCTKSFHPKHHLKRCIFRIIHLSTNFILKPSINTQTPFLTSHKSLHLSFPKYTSTIMFSLFYVFFFLGIYFTLFLLLFFCYFILFFIDKMLVSFFTKTKMLSVSIFYCMYV
jgi:hypothetical protein